MPQLNSPFLVCLSIFANAVLLPKSLGALTDGSVESPAMHPNPTVGRPPGQRGRKPGRRKTKVTGPWSQKSSVLGPQSIQPGKGLEPIKVPKKRGPKPGSKVGMMWFRDAIRDRQLPLPAGAIQPNTKKHSFPFTSSGAMQIVLVLFSQVLRYSCLRFLPLYTLLCIWLSCLSMVRSVDYSEKFGKTCCCWIFHRCEHHRENYFHLTLYCGGGGNLTGTCQKQWKLTTHTTLLNTIRG